MVIVSRWLSTWLIEAARCRAASDSSALMRLVTAISLSCATSRNTRQNLLFTAAYDAAARPA